MPEIIQILGPACTACLIMAGVLGYFGTHVLKREIIFVDIALAQIAAVGAIIAHLALHVHADSATARIFSIVVVLGAGAFYAGIRSKIPQLSLEAIIGVTYAISAAAALFLVGLAPGSHIHIHHILAGNLLWTSSSDIFLILAVSTPAALCFYIFRRPLTAVAEDCAAARSAGISVFFWDLLFYALLGTVITFAVSLAGIVVVFAYLIIPTSIAFLLSGKNAGRSIIMLLTAAAGTVGGLLFAYRLDFSLAPSIALVLGVELLIAALAAQLKTT